MEQVETEIKVLHIDKYPSLSQPSHEAYNCLYRLMHEYILNKILASERCGTLHVEVHEKIQTVEAKHLLHSIQQIEQ